MSAFGFTEEHEMWRRTVRDFAQREIAPGAKEYAKHEGFPIEVYRKIAEMGYFGINIPVKYGGQEADLLSLGILVEELARVALCAAQAILVPSMAPLALGGASQRIRDDLLPRLASGENSSCIGMTEPGCGSDAASMQTTAIKQGDYYVINGEKTSISMSLTENCIGFIYAKTDPSAGARGISCLLTPLNLPGITVTRLSHSGWKQLGPYTIFMDDVRVPAENLIGEEGRGLATALNQFQFLRACLGLISVGMAEISIEDAIAYAKERFAFGKPIAKFEGVSFKIAEHATLIEAVKLLSYRALWLQQQGLPCFKEVCMVKWWAPQVAVHAIHDALLIHGHVGYSEEYPLEQRLRDAIGIEFTDGTPENAKMSVAREILGKEYLPY